MIFTPNGRRMPVDAEPSDDGNVLLRWETNEAGGRDAHAVAPRYAQGCAARRARTPRSTAA